VTRILFVNNLKLNVMDEHAKNSPSDKSDEYYYPKNRIKWFALEFTLSGILVSVLWLCLFIAGLLVNSSYYRAAISYNIADLNDWLLAIITFTFSNVVLLAFMSGLLGGITSKLIFTKGFKVTVKEFRKTNTFQVENPFISAFRGMFVFIAILFMQYVSSFSDLGALNKNPEQEQKNMEVKFEKIYSRLAENGRDSVILDEVRSEIDKQLADGKVDDPDPKVIDSILLLKENLRVLTYSDSQSDSIRRQKMKIEGIIRSLRRTVKVPSISDFSGIGLSSFSYFKFAVIVSFLSFMSGYDPSLFKVITDRITKKPEEKEKDDPEKNEENKT